MSFYQKITEIGKKYNILNKLFKPVFNFSPMYSRSTARLTKVSEDLHYIEVKIPISYKNRNYNGSIFGGSMFSAVDPVPMVQLVNLLDTSYVVWDKSAEIFFKKPAREDIYADFDFSPEEIQEIKTKVKELKEYTFVKQTQLVSKDRRTVFCVINKTIYVADKAFYKEKLRLRKEASGSHVIKS